MKTIILSGAAAKEVEALPVAPREAVDQALGKYAISGRGKVKRLGGAGSRLRVGDYRVFFDEDAETITVLSVRRRTSTTYRR